MPTGPEAHKPSATRRAWSARWPDIAPSVIQTCRAAPGPIPRWHNLRRPFLPPRHPLCHSRRTACSIPEARKARSWLVKKRDRAVCGSRMPISQAPPDLRATAEMEAEHFRSFGLTNPIAIVPQRRRYPRMWAVALEVIPRSSLQNARHFSRAVSSPQEAACPTNAFHTWAEIEASPSGLGSFCDRRPRRGGPHRRLLCRRMARRLGLRTGGVARSPSRGLRRRPDFSTAAPI